MIPIKVLHSFNLILCIQFVQTHREKYLGIVTPVGRQPNQDYNNINITMFPPSNTYSVATENSNTNGIVPTTPATDNVIPAKLDTDNENSVSSTTPRLPFTKATTNGGTSNAIFGTTLATNINIYINITTNNASSVTITPVGTTTLKTTSEDSIISVTTDSITQTRPMNDETVSTTTTITEDSTISETSTSAETNTFTIATDISSEIDTASEDGTNSFSSITVTSSDTEIDSTTNQQDEGGDKFTTNIYDTTDDSVAENVVINIDLSEQNGNINFGVTTLGVNENNGGQATHIIQNKMIFEEKCEEYYSMVTRKTRKATVQVFIVGGTNSRPKEFPHMAALGYGKKTKKEWLCGGSLISENYVITAAHCLSSETLGNIQYVRLGTTNLQIETLSSADYNVIKRIPHPNYNKKEQYNDIALLQLDRSVKFSDSIAPICLYPSKNISGKRLIATGWGKTESAGEVSPELLKVELEYFSHNECQQRYAVIPKQELPRGIVDTSQICAGSRKEEKDTCQGDSGGPLQIQENERMYLVGITSFGIGCGKPGSPGVYTRVSYFIPWIERVVWGK